jgi:hypothetical protein
VRAEPAHTVDPKVGVSRRRLQIPVLIFLVWGTVLVSLALWTANPVTLNPLQIRQADLIVEAAVADLREGRCRVVRTWPEGFIPDTIRIAGLSKTGAVKGETYLMPLKRPPQADPYQIAPAGPEQLRLIYPADEQTRAQLEQILQAPRGPLNPDRESGPPS